MFKLCVIFLMVKYPVNAGVLQGSILGPTFCYSTLMTFLMILFIIVISMLMILLATQTVIRHLICGSNLNWLLKLNLIFETLWTGAGSGWLISVLEKVNLFYLTGQTTHVINVKMNGSVLEEKSSFKILGLTFSSKFYWYSYIISIV